MSGMKISELDFLRLLPVFMRDDAAVIALSKAVDQLLGEPGKRLSTIRTWDKIDELNEAECDELAWELDIDWYDSTLSLEQKRETIKTAQEIKRKRGTKWAVDRLIKIYLGEGSISEWHETGSDPFTFKVLTTNTQVTSENFEKFVETAKIAKNERSHLNGIFYYEHHEPSVKCAPGVKPHRYAFIKCGTHDRNATVGFIVKAFAETEPEEKAHLYSFPECGRNGVKATLGAAIVGTAVVGRAIVRS